jgi:hypothetical protein
MDSEVLQQVGNNATELGALTQDMHLLCLTKPSSKCAWLVRELDASLRSTQWRPTNHCKFL